MRDLQFPDPHAVSGTLLARPRFSLAYHPISAADRSSAEPAKAEASLGWRGGWRRWWADRPLRLALQVLRATQHLHAILGQEEAARGWRLASAPRPSAASLVAAVLLPLLRLLAALLGGRKLPVFDLPAEAADLDVAHPHLRRLLPKRRHHNAQIHLPTVGGPRGWHHSALVDKIADGNLRVGERISARGDGEIEARLAARRERDARNRAVHERR
mmetsp:Transcript_18772/g.61912  ORF Transcript_18772/g.61912 Transcript_18772/m.61912 type:complete len:215 (-) Transcript_18772:415-1059(-)